MRFRYRYFSTAIWQWYHAFIFQFLVLHRPEEPPWTNFSIIHTHAWVLNTFKIGQLKRNGKSIEVYGFFVFDLKTKTMRSRSRHGGTILLERWWKFKLSRRLIWRVPFGQMTRGPSWRGWSGNVVPHSATQRGHGFGGPHSATGAFRSAEPLAQASPTRWPDAQRTVATRVSSCARAANAFRGAYQGRAESTDRPTF